jgi:diaminobutyrate-2-oxoglutarate transaminase
MPVGKALGGIGLPLSAVVYSGELDTWEPGSHTGTFRGNVPAMRAGLRAIEYIDEHDLLAHARDLGEYIRSRLDEVKAETPCLGDVRGKGLFIGAEFDDRGSKSASEIVDEIQRRCLDEGAIVWNAGREHEVLRLLPPLVMTTAQAENGLDIICDAIEQTVPSKRSAT